jgi:hypothetical protein
MKTCGGRLTLFNLSAPAYEIFVTTRLQSFLGICREDGSPVLPDEAYG